MQMKRPTARGHKLRSGENQLPRAQEHQFTGIAGTSSNKAGACQKGESMKGMTQAELKRFEELTRENERLKAKVKKLERIIAKLKRKK